MSLVVALPLVLSVVSLLVTGLGVLTKQPLLMGAGVLAQSLTLAWIVAAVRHTRALQK